MHIPKLLSILVSLVFTFAGHGQVSADSLASLKQRKQYFELNSRVNEHKLQLARLENSVEKKSRDAVQAADDARKAAEENADAANRLNHDPQDKSKAKKARKAAHSAEHKAKEARRAADDLDDLKKNIESLKNKIAEDEAKLTSLPGAAPVKQ
jgi:chromosome segregation ATPase